jgi:hypothetical protein
MHSMRAADLAAAVLQLQYDWGVYNHVLQNSVVTTVYVWSIAGLPWA